MVFVQSFLLSYNLHCSQHTCNKCLRVVGMSPDRVVDEVTLYNYWQCPQSLWKPVNNNTEEHCINLLLYNIVSQLWY